MYPPIYGMFNTGFIQSNAAQYRYKQEQNIASVVKAFNDFLDGVEKVAPEYQSALCEQICYANVARMNRGRQG